MPRKCHRTLACSILIKGHRLPRRRPIEQLTHPHVFCQYKHNQDIMNVRNGLNSRGLKFLELLAAKPYQHEKKREKKEKKRKKIPMFGNGHPVFAISSGESLMTPVIRQSEDIAFILNCWRGDVWRGKRSAAKWRMVVVCVRALMREQLMRKWVKYMSALSLSLSLPFILSSPRFLLAFLSSLFYVSPPLCPLALPSEVSGLCLSYFLSLIFSFVHVLLSESICFCASLVRVVAYVHASVLEWREAVTWRREPCSLVNICAQASSGTHGPHTDFHPWLRTKTQ